MTEKQPLLSPRLISLQNTLVEEGTPALDAFWHAVKQRGTPMIEPIADESGQRFVTFLWRDTGDTQNVVLAGGPTRWGIWEKMTHLPASDVWYKTYKLRS